MSFKSLNDLDPNARELATLSTAWMDAFWDEGAGLLWYPGYESPVEKARRRSHMVRDTAWYVIGLFLRRQGPDVFRAIHAVHAILDYQFDAPAQPYHGTFARSPEEDQPPTEARASGKTTTPTGASSSSPLCKSCWRNTSRSCRTPWSRGSTPPPAWR